MAIDKVYVYGEEMAKSQDLQEISGSIPSNLSDLQDDSEHRLVTDSEKNTWNSIGSNWTLLGTITDVGSTYALDIPSTATEINIEVFGDAWDGTTFNILTANLTNNDKGYNGGFYKNSQDNMRILVYANNSQIWVQEIIKNNQSKSAPYSCAVYYK